MPPAEAAKTFHVLDGFEMQLIAAEPLITDPVAITYDEDGRAYVCEMNDYPYTDKERHKHNQENPADQAIGKVRLLTDSDGDGDFDTSTVFADGLSWPTGAACWKGGIFVTATPDIWYLKDTTGDGVADVRQKIFTGFKKLNVQAVMNNPIWGLDHRIYVAGGSNGGEIQRASGSESVMPLPQGFKPIPFRRNDFSFDPSTGDVRLESGGARFGQTFDDWGNRFLCNIRNPCQHVVIPHRYLVRNPYLTIPSPLNDCAEAGDQLPVFRTSPPEPWREFRAKRWSSEGSTLPKSELVGAGVVTSSSGITVYRGDAYPNEYRDFAFVADVAGNLFYRMKLVPDGVTFKAVQVDGKKNFCTSDDTWFRPVNFTNAPDGCLHVCDMYREVIEHPWSIPDDIHASLDLLRGRDRGRIWRLAPKRGATVQVERKDRQAGSLPNFKLSTATTSELVALLDHRNAWHRETAQRLLFERQDKTAIEPLRTMVREGKTVQGRQNAVYAMNAQLAFEEEFAIQTLESPNSPLRAAVLETALSSSGTSKAFENALIEMADDPSPEVRMRLAWLFGNQETTVLKALGQVTRMSLEDPWLRYALLSAPSLHVASSAAASLRSKESQGMIKFIQQAGVIVGSTKHLAFDRREGDPIDKGDGLWHILLFALKSHARTHSESVEAGMLGLSQGLSRQNLSVAEVARGRGFPEWVDEMTAAAMNKAKNDRLDSESRVRAVHLLSIGKFEATHEACAELLKPSIVAELQFAALEALGSYREPGVADIVIEAWPKLTPPLRDKAIGLLISRTERIAKLLDAMEAKRILPGQINAASRAVLMRQKDAKLAGRIARLFDAANSNRGEVVARYAKAMQGGNAASGAKIYETACMVCHKHGDRGNDVGPHLGTVKAWPAEQILTNILDPNREVSPNFSLYIIETNDGRTISGIITGETAGNLTLKLADGSQQSLLRTEIKSLASPGISLMPDGLEAAITSVQMADLIEFIRR